MGPAGFCFGRPLNARAASVSRERHPHLAWQGSAIDLEVTMPLEICLPEVFLGILYANSMHNMSLY